MKREVKYVIAISGIVVAGLVASSCCKTEHVKKKIGSQYKITCGDVEENLERCENQEVVCYGNGGIGISCKFK